MICALLLLGLGILAAGDTIGMRLGHLDGMILLGFFAGYIVAMIQSAMKARAAGKNVDMEGMEELEGEIRKIRERMERILRIETLGQKAEKLGEELEKVQKKCQEHTAQKEQLQRELDRFGALEAVRENIADSLQICRNRQTGWNLQKMHMARG